jgi:chemotaxis protein CheD
MVGLAWAAPQGTAPVHTLHPGDVVCATLGERLQTLLGSCVAVVLTDPRRTVGVMCHIVHTGPARQAVDTAGAECALAAMRAALRRHGLQPGQCEAYVYGGGNMFPKLYAQAHVGAANTEWVLKALAHDGVPVLVCDVGGNRFRQLAWTVGKHAPQVTAVEV